MSKVKKKCSKCGKILPLAEFYKNKNKKDGLYDYCKKCDKAYYMKNRKTILKKNKKWNKNNHEKMKKYYKKYQLEHKDKIREYNRLWRENNREKLREYHRLWRKRNPEKAKEWRLNNREYMNSYTKNKIKTDIKFNLNLRMSSSISHSLKGNKKGRHWESLVGYTANDLIKRLKKMLPKNYTWQDYLEAKLHIDHIIPISAFNFTKPEQIDFQRCWSLENLQLLPARENIVKKDKLTEPFQPSLQLNIIEMG